MSSERRIDMIYGPTVLSNQLLESMMAVPEVNSQPTMLGVNETSGSDLSILSERESISNQASIIAHKHPVASSHN